MKNFFAIATVFTLLLSMAACSGNNSAPSSVQTSSQSETSQAEPSSAGASSVSGAASEPQSTSVSDTLPEDAPTEDAAVPEAAAGSNILVAYFSRVGNMDYDPDVDAVASASVNLSGNDISGNAQLLAEMAQEVTGGDLFFLETAEKYPAAYRDTTDQAKTEQNEDARPELISHVENMDAYDTIILIYPNWWGTIPQAVCTFLEEYDFSGKTIWPLCTHEGSGLGSSERDIAALVPDAQLSQGLAVRGSRAGSSQADVALWLDSLRMAE